jgi:hypothetical protein
VRKSLRHFTGINKDACYHSSVVKVLSIKRAGFYQPHLCLSRHFLHQFHRDAIADVSHFDIGSSDHQLFSLVSDAWRLVKLSAVCPLGRNLGLLQCVPYYTHFPFPVKEFVRQFLPPKQKQGWAPAPTLAFVLALIMPDKGWLYVRDYVAEHIGDRSTDQPQNHDYDHCHEHYNQAILNQTLRPAVDAQDHSDLPSKKDTIAHSPA